MKKNITLIALILFATIQSFASDCDTLRLLHIGNSFTNDATSMLGDMVRKSGINTSNLCIYKYVRASGSFKTFTLCWNDMNKTTYYISKVVGGIDQDIKDNGDECSGYRLRYAIQNNKWDVIVIQQVSSYSNDFSLWEGRGEGGYVKEMLDTLKKYQPKAKIGICITHAAYSQNKNTFERFNEIAKAHKMFCAKYDVDFVIPYGTAVENIRQSSINTTIKGFSRDGTHLAEGVGKYVASAAYFESVIAPLYGITILGNKSRYIVSESTISNSNTPLEYVSVTEDNYKICQKAAVQAVENKFEITDISIDEEMSGIYEPKVTQSFKTTKKVVGNNILILNGGRYYNSVGIELSIR